MIPNLKAAMEFLLSRKSTNEEPIHISHLEYITEGESKEYTFGVVIDDSSCQSYVAMLFDFVRVILMI